MPGLQVSSSPSIRGISSDQPSASYKSVGNAQNWNCLGDQVNADTALTFGISGKNPLRAAQCKRYDRAPTDAETLAEES